MLSNTDIMRELDSGRIEIDGFDESRLNTNSYDLLLGNTFYEVVYDDRGPIYVGPQVYLDNERVYIPVGGTLLGHTSQRIATHNNIVGVLYSPSTTARMGISICFNAGLGDIGFDNMWTVEMSSFVRVGKPFINVCDRIAQIVFFYVESRPIQNYTGQYNRNDCDWPLCMVPRDFRDRVIPYHSKLEGIK